MFSWNFAKSAEEMFSGWAIKRICKFLLKKKLGQLILGDIDLNQLDVQLRNGSFQLSDLALNVDYLNQKLGETAMLAVKEGSIGSLEVKLPWKGRGGCQIEVNELELVLARHEAKTSQVGSETSTSTQDSNISSTNDLGNIEHGIVDNAVATASVDLHEGVKTIAKMVKWLLTSFHVKIKNLIVAFDPSTRDVENNVLSRTLVLRFREVECGTDISEDINSYCKASIDRFLGLNRLTNFVKFDGAVLEFLQIDNDDSQSPNSSSSGTTLGERYSECCPSNATTPIIIGEEGGFSGTIKLSIPWKNGSLDIRKVDADVNVDPLELRFEPRSIQCFIYLVDMFKEMGKNSKTGMHNTATESVYFSAASHIDLSTLASSKFSADKRLGNHESFSVDSYSFSGKETVTDALLRGSHLISDWVTSPICRNQKERTEEPDFGASVDQFFECFDGLRNSQSALGNSGMWNWTCSVFSAITAASNLASGSLHIPSEQKHVETNLKARFAGIRILFSLVDAELKHSCDSKGDQKNPTSHAHYICAEFQDMQLGLQVCPREMNFEVTVKHIEIADHFSNEYDVGDIGLHGQDDDVKTQAGSIRNLQAAVQDACPPFCPVVDDDELAKPRECTVIDVTSNISSLSRCTSRRSCRGIYRDGIVKVVLLQTSAVTQAQFTVTSVSSDDTFSRPISFSLKLPPFVFWVNFHLISVTIELIKQIGHSLGMDSTENLSASESLLGECRPSSSQENGSQGSSPHVTTLPPEGTLSGNIFLLNARVFLCFPCGNNEDLLSYSSWSQFIVLDFSSPYSLCEKKVRDSNPFQNSSPKERYSVTRSLHLNVGNLDIYAIASTSQYNDSFGKLKTKFSAQKTLSVANKDGHPSVFGMFWQEGRGSDPSLVNRAKVLATSDGTSCRHKFMGKGYEFVSVTTIKDMEDFNSRTRQDMLFSSAFMLHVQLFPVTVFLDSTQYKALHDLLHQVGEWATCITSDPVGAKENILFSQTSVLVECETVEFSLSVKAVESLKDSIQNELPGSWHRLKLNIRKFELLSVSNIGGIKDASFLWASHGEGSLWGSITEVPDQEFLLISCNDSTRGRGGGEGSNILSSRFSGSDIVHLWDPESFQSHVSINIRCGTIVATGGRLDWLDSIISFFSLSSPETNQVGDDNVQKEDVNGGSFILNLVDVGLSYEPYFCKLMVGERSSYHFSANVNGKLSDQYFAGFLGASSLKLSNVMAADSAQSDYKIRVQDLGLLLCEVSGPNKVGGCHSAKHLRKTGYVKVAQEAHVEALLRMNCKNGHLWEVECCDSDVVLGTCQDTTSGLIRLAAQLQQLFAPDIEESVAHLQTRWDRVQQELATDGATNSSTHFSPSTSQMNTSSVDTYEEAGVINLMDEICEGAFCLDGNWENQFGISESELSSPPNDIVGETWTFSTVDPESTGLENSPTSSSQTSITDFIEEYFISDLRPLSELSLNNQSFNENIETKSKTVKDEARRGNTGWYGDTSLRILENHVLNVGERINLNQLLDSEAPCNQVLNDDNKKVKGRVLLKNVNVRWRLYGGSDWQDTQKNVQHASSYRRDTIVCLELALSGIGVQYDTFPDGDICVSRLSFSIQDFRLYDNSKDAPWKQVLGYYQSKDHPRESSSKALKLDLEVVRPNPSTPLEEYRLQIALHPMLLHLHQRQLDFLISFFGGKGSSNNQSQSSQGQCDSGMAQEQKDNQGSYNIIEEALLPYFQKFDIWPVLLRVDYSPSRVDLAALRGGKYVELVNLVSWKGVELQLKHVQAVGVYGWSCVCDTIVGEWLEDVSQNQIHKLLKGLPPIRSLVAVGSGAAKLVSLPLKSYRKDQKIVKGMQRGTIAFLRSISREAIGLGVHLAAGAHDILLQTEYILTSTSPPSVPRPLQSRVDTNIRSNQPKDARQGIQQAFGSITDGLGKSAFTLVQTPLRKYQHGAGVGSALASAVQAAPAAAIAPASAVARAMHVALLGARNSLDPEHKKESMNKYHGTNRSRSRSQSQSQPR